jgi:hypothetical protein
VLTLAAVLVLATAIVRLRRLRSQAAI